MEMDRSERIARWYYKTSLESQWQVFSSFALPKIGNPYFNVGDFNDIGPFAALSNSPSGLAHFLQFGISSSNSYLLDTAKAAISFSCPAYYTSNNERRCISEVAPLPGADPHWKVLWKWGV
jgi:hypothetical protein